MASTASHSPSARTSSSSSVTRARTRSSWERTPRGVKRRATTMRWRWCSGSSLLIIDESSRWSVWGRDPSSEL